MSLRCLYAGLCSGCDTPFLEFAQNTSELEALRNKELQHLIPSLRLSRVTPTFHHIPSQWDGGSGRLPSDGLRDRVDFTIDFKDEPKEFRSGFFQTAISTEVRSRRELVDLNGCAQFSKELDRFYQELRMDPPRAKRRGSVRLRVGPNGLKGIWLDYSNEDIRDLLHDGDWLNRAFAKSWIVEMGQRRKRVIRGESRFQLVDPVLENWFETLNYRRERVPLFSTIGTFTQPGLRANLVLVDVVLNEVDRFQSRHVVEFGCGIGNFTLGLARHDRKLSVFEFDELALDGLAKGFKVLREKCGDLRATDLSVHCGDFIRKSNKFNALDALAADSKPDLILVDPPRSGLGQFLSVLEHESLRRANWIYVSCYPETLAKDILVLEAHGLRLEKLQIVEQFPFTRHFEAVATIVAPNLS